MKRYIWIPLLASLALLTLGAAPARAQSEVTPFVSLGSVNSSRAGAAIRFAWTSDLAGGVGLEQFAFAIGQPGGLVATHSSVAFTVNAGGGVRVPLNDRWGYRSDVRWVNNLSRQGGEHWRVYNGVTFKTGAR